MTPVKIDCCNYLKLNKAYWPSKLIKGSSPGLAVMPDNLRPRGPRFNSHKGLNFCCNHVLDGCSGITS